MPMSVTVKFIGALRHAANKSTMTINCPTNFSIKELIQKILTDIPEIKTDIINQQADGTMKSTVLLLVNEKEISVLNGLDTLLTNNDEIVFIPIAHGG
ncbi:MAG: MoaD/ThiS family protein [Nitrososphaerota archaeon]|jgi:molybdopterin converting factor small subunit|nr:MoaD/ThiS family protein [Nitrososphaerota archaeon]